MKRRRALLLALLLLVAAVVAVALDPHRRVQGRAGGEPFFDGRAASAWRNELSQPGETRSAEAITALVAGKSDAVPVCAWVLRTANEPEARWRAADVLRQLGKAAAAARPELVAALSDQDPLVRGVAIRAIAELAPDVPGAVTALVALFPDVDSIRAVSRFGVAGAEAVPRLTELLRHDDTTVRWQAARTLGKIGTPAISAVPELARLTVSDPEALVREHAAEGLGDIGSPASAGIPALVIALKDPVARVRRDAVRALGQMGPAAKESLAAVQNVAQDPDPDVKAAATRAIRAIDPGKSK